MLLSTKQGNRETKMSNDESESDDEQSVVTRRRLVAGAAGWATVGLAGCSRILDPSMREDDDGNGSGNGDGTGNGNGADTPTADGNGDGTGNGDSGGNGNGSGTPTGNTTVTNETTTTSPGETTTSGGGCASIRRFSAGMEVGLHVGVFDSDSGSALGDNSVEGVTVEFPDADFEPIELNWEGDHEVYDESTWGGKLETNEDVDPGTYRYEISVDGEDVEQTIVDEITIV
jgi:hypothetical protein